MDSYVSVGLCLDHRILGILGYTSNTFQCGSQYILKCEYGDYERERKPDL